MDSPGDDTVSQIQAAKEAGYIVPPEIAKIGDDIADIVSRLPSNSFGRFLGWSYVVTLAEGGFGNPEIEKSARFLVLKAINSEENTRFLEFGK